MRPSSRLTSITGLVVGIALFATACSAAATDTPAATVAGATDTAMAAGMTPAATDTTAPGTSAMDTAAADGTVTIGLTDDATLGAYLTGKGGMTLYVFKSDTAATSTCSGTCATNWPPLTSTAGASIIPPSAATAAFGTINRPDGTIQVTYNHMPLYYYAGDSAAGDTNGQGKLNLWYVAPASGSLGGAAATTSPSGY